MRDGGGPGSSNGGRDEKTDFLPGRKPGEAEGYQPLPQGTEGNWFGGKDEELSYGLLRRTFQWTRPSASWRAKP